MKYGIPQGSVLGSVFVVMRVNDYLHGLSCDAVMSAEYVEILRGIGNPSDVTGLQNDTGKQRTVMFSIN